jgi:hypothetical protein
VAAVPNRDCPLVQGPIGRYKGHYWPPTLGEICTNVLALPGLAYWALRGLQFATDQTLVPYDVTVWMNKPAFSASEVPNRFVFVAEKQSAWPSSVSGTGGE